MSRIGLAAVPDVWIILYGREKGCKACLRAEPALIGGEWPFYGLTSEWIKVHNNSNDSEPKCRTRAGRHAGADEGGT